jgi:hypothetical protein
MQQAPDSAVQDSSNGKRQPSNKQTKGQQCVGISQAHCKTSSKDPSPDEGHGFSRAVSNLEWMRALPAAGKLGFVSGHHFSRAVKLYKYEGFSP